MDHLFHSSNENMVPLDMHLSRTDILKLLRDWLVTWCQHDLEGVLDLLHEDIEFENWTGSTVKGKYMLRKAWAPWFQDHGDFLFTEEEIFVDAPEQKALLRWRLDWPAPEKELRGQRESRRGVDVLHFLDGRIRKKYSYTKTTVLIDDRPVSTNDSPGPDR